MRNLRRVPFLVGLLVVGAGCVRVMPAGGLLSKDDVAEGVLIKPAEGWKVNSRPAWSPDGQRLAYSMARTRSEEPSYELSRCYVRDLTTRLDTYVGDGWSPTGVALAMDGVGLVVGERRPRQVVTKKIGAKQERVLYEIPAEGMSDAVAWSAQGDRAAVGMEVRRESEGAQDSEVVVIDRQGKSITIWDVKGQSISGLQWSRDGKLLWDDYASYATPHLKSGEEVLCVATGPAWRVRTVRPSVAGLKVDPGAWSPDGRKVVAYARGSSASDGPSVRLYSIDVATCRATLLTEGRREWPHGGQVAEWSPGGRWIAFREEVIAGTLDNYIRLVPSTGGKVVDLLGPMHDRTDWMTWSPDGKRLAYVAGGRVKVVDVRK